MGLASIALTLIAAMHGQEAPDPPAPESSWGNPAVQAGGQTHLTVLYRTATAYRLHTESSGIGVTTSSEAATTFVDPLLLPAFLGVTTPLGAPDDRMSLAICYVRPAYLRYSLDEVNDPLQTAFTPDSEVEQAFHVMRVALARDFRLRPEGDAGFLPRIAAGVALDAGLAAWTFRFGGETSSDTATSFGGGAGIRADVYDDGESFRAGLGIAWRAALRHDFATDPALRPAFDLPQQLSVDATFDMLDKRRLSVTLRFAWQEWSEASERPRFSTHDGFDDAMTLAVDIAYRIELSETMSVRPRLGYARWRAPWSDADDLPMVGNFKLTIDTDDATFDLFTLGAGLMFASADGKHRAIDLAIVAGGDSLNVALGYTHGF